MPDNTSVLDLDDTELKDLAKKAIHQIRAKQYYTDMDYRGIRNIILLGIAFSGKKVAVLTEQK